MLEIVRRTYRAVYSKETGGWVAHCDEYPSLSWVAGSVDDAFNGLHALIFDSEDASTHRDHEHQWVDIICGAIHNSGAGHMGYDNVCTECGYIKHFGEKS